ncbi:FHA domain-containing protein FhaA [Planctomycetes bacterium Pan216]|uniref:FHA domain-containing protein FhaA n=1 Tax=Kolteria novifilia TaxID=2527975 RepID=A0A518B9Q9_9BACT|nr:FHA domain-containing protein FhaA [Planctomycetes bacterium Pan216]
MAYVSFHVVDGVDKGRSYLNLPTPVTIGREEGNAIRLNDERISRYHVKVQEDDGRVVLTDLDSTNGTCVNGEVIQLRLLRAGDRVSVGRSVLMFGNLDEVADLLRQEQANDQKREAPNSFWGFKTLAGGGTQGSVAVGSEDIEIFERDPPPLPEELSPAQAAQLSEVLDYLHRFLATATRPVTLPKEGHEARLPRLSWQQIQAAQLILARYSRSVGQPNSDTSITTLE